MFSEIVSKEVKLIFNLEIKKRSINAPFFLQVPGAGLEPARPYGQWILSP